MNIDKHFKHLINLAEGIEEPVKCFRLAAGVIHKNMLISTGVNSYKTDPFQARFGSTEHAIHLHAEVSAIKTSLRKLSVDDLQKATLVVVRVKKKDHNKIYRATMAKPCVGCQRCLAEFGIKNVFYSGECGGIYQL
jgi:cytidine deaminase